VFSCSVRHRDLPSFPTRRSSDLARVAVGNIGGLPWGNETLPPDVYGFWGNETGVYLQGYPKIVGYAYATSHSFISSPSVPAGSVVNREEFFDVDFPSYYVASGRRLVAIYPMNHFPFPFLLVNSMPAPIVLRGWSFQLEGKAESTGQWESFMVGPETYTQFRVRVRTSWYLVDD